MHAGDFVHRKQQESAGQSVAPPVEFTHRTASRARVNPEHGKGEQESPGRIPGRHAFLLIHIEYPPKKPEQFRHLKMNHTEATKKGRS